MIELISLLLLSDRISTKARLKGYISTGRFVLLLIIMWCSFELIGVMIIAENFNQTVFTNSFFDIQYLFVLVLAFIGAFISFGIVHSLKTKEILANYDPDIKIELPFIVNLLEENIFTIITVCVLSLIFIYNFSLYFIIMPLFVFIFTKYGIYKIFFQSDEIVFKYLYGRKKIIQKKQVVKITLNNKLFIELHWKKSSRHSTKSIKFPSNSFIVNKIPIENIKEFLQTTYNG